jgi:hypothetical protein
MQSRLLAQLMKQVIAVTEKRTELTEKITNIDDHIYDQ